MRDINCALLLLLFTIFPYGQCTTVCEDDIKYRLLRLSDQSLRSCEWVAYTKGRQEKWCNVSSKGQKVKDACPVTCNNCSCIDDVDFKFSTNKLKMKGCSWIKAIPGRSGKWCNRSRGGGKIRNFCPVTCNNCCTDDADYEFNIPLRTSEKKKRL